jgi:hypothetical protein
VSAVCNSKSFPLVIAVLRKFRQPTQVEADQLSNFEVSVRCYCLNLLGRPWVEGAVAWTCGCNCHQLNTVTPRQHWLLVCLGLVCCGLCQRLKAPTLIFCYNHVLQLLDTLTQVPDQPRADGGFTKKLFYFLVSPVVEQPPRQAACWRRSRRLAPLLPSLENDAAAVAASVTQVTADTVITVYRQVRWGPGWPQHGCFSQTWQVVIRQLLAQGLVERVSVREVKLVKVRIC